jgi:dienelactone hydrolase
MKARHIVSLTSLALLGATVSSHLLKAAEAPPMGGGYTTVIPIPVNDPSIKEIAGALFKPQGSGPFPAIVYMSGCNGLNFPPEVQQEKRVIDSYLAKGIATLIVDPFTPRGEKDGVCEGINEKTFVQVFTRGGNDVVAALKALKAMPDIDPNRIFLQGYSYGAIASLYATDMKTPGTHDTKVAGVIAYYPYCYDNIDLSVPTLVLIGDKDDFMSVAACQAITGKANFELVVYPGATHGFTEPFEKPLDFDGHHLAHDEAATTDAQKRAEAFIAAHLK